MKHPRLTTIMLLAILALAATITASAQAISPAPFFTISGTRLAAGKTHAFATHIVKAYVLNTPEQGTKIECTKLTVDNGAIEGSSEGTPGKAHGIANFTGCALGEGNGAPNCKLTEEAITTNPLTSIQVENVSGGGGGKQLLKDIFPTSGANFVTLHFTGTGCTTKETAVSGQTVAEILFDDTAEEKIELGQTAKEATSWKIRFPEVAIKEVWLINGGVGKIAKTKQLAFGDASTQTGTDLTLLASPTGVDENVLWSPLP